MTAPETVLIIGAVSTGLVNIIQTWWNGKKSAEGRREIKAKVEEVHDRVNGLSDARNDATETSAFAKGVLAQREDEGQKKGPINP